MSARHCAETTEHFGGRSASRRRALCGDLAPPAGQWEVQETYPGATGGQWLTLDDAWNQPPAQTRWRLAAEASVTGQ